MNTAMSRRGGIFSLADLQENLPAYVSPDNLVNALADTPHVRCLPGNNLAFWCHTLVRLAKE